MYINENILFVEFKDSYQKCVSDLLAQFVGKFCSLLQFVLAVCDSQVFWFDANAQHMSKK